MKEQNLASPRLEERVPREAKASTAAQSEYVTEGPKWRLSEGGKDVPGKRMQQRWEAQWQEFLKMLQAPYSAWGNLPPLEKTPWDDAKGFLASFEQVAEACRWPRGEWVVRLLPALSGEAEQAFQDMVSTDKEDYGKVKAAILRADALRMEMQRQHFRQFCCQEIEDPRRVHGQLQELCHRWLKPERRSKEQILELVILEQFLASLPPDLQSWIRAGGPETCAQAVSLVEDFMMTHQEPEPAKWQGPSQGVRVGSLAVEEVPSDAAQRQIYKDDKQIDDSKTTLLGNGLKCPSHSISLLPPEGQVVTEAGPGEGLLNLKEPGVSLHVVERTLTQPGQQTMFWQVLQEDGGNVQLFGDGKATPLKVENPQRGGNELEETPRAMPPINQEKVPLAAKMHEERCDEKRRWIKMEKSQEGESLPKEKHRVLAETSLWSIPLASEIHNHRYGSVGQEGREPQDEEQKESSELTQGLTDPSLKTSGVPLVGGKALFSRYGRKYHYKSDLVIPYAGGNLVEYPTWGEDVQSKSFLNQPQETLTGEKLQVIPECGEEGVHQKDVFAEHQNSHTGKKHDECWADRGGFRPRPTLHKYKNAKSRRELYICSLCGKSFTSRAELTRHQRIHTGEKPYKCPECGRSFNRRENLMRHHRIHTGEKPYECSWCRKCFRWKEQLTGHQRIHAGE